MKRIISAICALAMLMCCFSAAAESVNSSLPDITLKVKTALEIGDSYDDFSSSNYNGMWDLYWSGEENELSVTCDENGRIYNYYLYDYDYTYSGDYEPRYPAYSVQQLSDIANEFLGRVVTGENEGWVIDSVDSTLQHGSEARVSVGGRITLFDNPTDISFDISIDMSSGKVTSFYRSDSYMNFSDSDYDMTEAISAEEALDKLASTVEMEAVYYITDENDMARLMYMPADDNRHIVRASDGELIDMEEAYNEIYNYGYAEDAAMTMEAGGYGEEPKLTDAELEGISVYDNALSVEALDELMRGMEELGITGDFYISGANYYEQAESLVASLRYVHKLSDEEKKDRGLDGDYDQYDTKHLTVDAYNGKLIDLFSSYPGSGNEVEGADESALADRAAAFLNAYYPECDVVNISAILVEDTYSLRFARVHNGYQFRENWINIDVNAETGCIDRFDMNWYSGQEFYEYEPNEIISADAARDAYLEGYEFESAFAIMPVGVVDEWEAQYELVYCWQLRNVNNFYAVEATSGEPLTANENADEFFYSDISGHEHEAIIARLGGYGIGFSGGKYEPEKPFTVRDALVFIAQAAQYNYGMPIEERGFEELKARVKELGADGFEGYAEDDVLTRGEFAGALACMSGYAKAAELTGIYDCGFTDNDDIADDDYGKVAIAYALGLIDVDAEGRINAGTEITRADAALIFDRLLSMK